MSMRNDRTGRYADDLMVKLNTGEATVGDVLAHSQEILAEAPEIWGTVVTEPVRLLLEIIVALAGGTPVHVGDKVTDLPSLRG